MFLKNKKGSGLIINVLKTALLLAIVLVVLDRLHAGIDIDALAWKTVDFFKNTLIPLANRIVDSADLFIRAIIEKV